MPSNGSIPAREMIGSEVDAPRNQRNESVLINISCLPAEIIANIFLLVRAECLCTRNDLQWITISHVSMCWRTIALNYVALWTQPPFNNHLWASEMLKRSKLAKLSIRFDFEPHKNRTFIAPTLSQLEQDRACYALLKQTLARYDHISKLDLLNVPLEQQDFVDSLSVDRPSLKKLNIDGRSPRFNRIGRLVHVPGSIISGAGKLRQLKLSFIRSDWISHLQPSITNLQLYKVDTISKSAILQLVNALENMPALEVLELTNSFPALGVQDHSHRRISLRKLQRLYVGSHLSQAAIFFHHITFPPTAYIFVDATDDEPESQTISYVTENTSIMLAAIVQSYSNCPSEQTFRSMYLNAGSLDEGIGIKLIPNEQNTKSPVASLSLCLNARLFSDSGVCASVLQEIFQCGFHLDDISYVYLAHQYPSQALAHTIGQLPNVSHIKTSKSTDTTIANNLIQALQLPIASASEELCFGNLSTLEFHNIEFLDLSSHEPDVITISKLQDCLIRRYECGAEITKLCLPYCARVSMDSVALLREVVVDIYWDNKKSGFTHSDYLTPYWHMDDTSSGDSEY